MATFIPSSLFVMREICGEREDTVPDDWLLFLAEQRTYKTSGRLLHFWQPQEIQPTFGTNRSNTQTFFK